jgi:superfamily II RNA helicase
MTEDSMVRDQAVEQLQTARERRDRSSEHYEAARESPGELRAFTELQTALDQFAAREAWLAWVDRDY